MFQFEKKNMSIFNLSSGSLLNDFENSVFLFSSLLNGHIAMPNRDFVFHVSFPETWAQSDIVNHFRKYGPVFIRWIDNVSAFVSLSNRENAPILMKTIGITKGVKISTFETYRRESGADKDEVCIDINISDIFHTISEQPFNCTWCFLLI